MNALLFGLRLLGDFLKNKNDFLEEEFRLKVHGEVWLP